MVMQFISRHVIVSAVICVGAIAMIVYAVARAVTKRATKAANHEKMWSWE